MSHKRPRGSSSPPKSKGMLLLSIYIPGVCSVLDVLMFNVSIVIFTFFFISTLHILDGPYPPPLIHFWTFFISWVKSPAFTSWQIYIRHFVMTLHIGLSHGPSHRMILLAILVKARSKLVLGRVPPRLTKFQKIISHS